MLSVLQDYGAGVQQQHAMHHHGAPVPGMHEAQQTMQVHDMMAHLTPEQLAMMHANLAAAGPPGGAQMDGQVGRMQLQYCCIASHSWGPDGRVGGSHAAAILLHSEPQLGPFSLAGARWTGRWVVCSCTVLLHSEPQLGPRRLVRGGFVGFDLTYTVGDSTAQPVGGGQGWPRVRDFRDSSISEYTFMCTGEAQVGWRPLRCQRVLCWVMHPHQRAEQFSVDVRCIFVMCQL